MLSNGKELLGELYGRDHLTYEKIEDLELTVVTEKGETVSPEELRGKIFRVVDRDERPAVEALSPGQKIVVRTKDGDRLTVRVRGSWGQESRHVGCMLCPTAPQSTMATLRRPGVQPPPP